MSTLVKSVNTMNFSNIKKGSVVTVWTHPKGHNYVVAGEDTENRKLLLVKLNCLNNDSYDVHKATKRFHKTVSYTVVGDNNVVKGVSRVLGQKNIDNYNFDLLLENYRITSRTKAHVVNARRNFVCTPVSDNTESTSY